MKRNVFAWVAVFSVATQAMIGVAQETGNSPRETRLNQMRRIAERIKVTAPGGSEPKAIPFIASPLLRFDDPTREFHDGTLWAWESEGRPVCLLTVEKYGDDSWFELISLTDVKVTATAGATVWKPQTAGVTLKSSPKSPGPAKVMARRLTQMKELLGELSAHEIGGTGTRYELRLMPTPVHRYSMPSEQLLDGAIFAFANGTNPEMLAVIEARGEKIESAQWQLGFVRCGAAELHVLFEERELFHVPYARGTRPTDPYWNFSDRDLAKDD